MTLTKRLQVIERKRAALLERVSAMDATVLDGRVRPATWSIKEIVEHLVLAEEDVLVDIRALDRLEPRPRRWRNRMAYVVVMFVLKYDIPVKAPSSAMLPAGNLSLADLRDRWESNHRHLRGYVLGLDRAAQKRAVFRHPITGPITVRGALRMLDVHLERHARQIRRLERRLRSLRA
jgi:hypothetical protein